MQEASPADRLFNAGRFPCVEITVADIPRLQQFFEANPQYHVAVNGELRL